MLNAKNDRLDYGAQLRPPGDYELDYAITTTYSLDLEAILLVPVALYFSESLDFSPHEDRDDLLEALTNASNQIVVYCQRGKIKAPTTYNKLMAFWEKGIQQIQMPHFNQSFHPKIWLIRFTPKKKGLPVKYRFINTSRNLSFSRDWDMAFSTDGEVNKTFTNQNQELVDLLKYLENKGDKPIPKIFYKELPNVCFDVPHNFDSLQFHPIGIPKSKTTSNYSNPVGTQSADLRLVMSPFLCDETISRLTESSKTMILFSSENELSNIKKDTLSKVATPYRFFPFIEDAETMEELSEPGTEALKQHLHAKFYIDKKGSNISWYLGSANATSPAYGRNIEFLVQLKTTSKKLQPQNIEKQLTTSDANNICLFEPYEGVYKTEPEEEKIREQNIRRLIHGLSAIEIQGEAYQNESGLYNLKITIPKSDLKVPEGWQVKCKPLPERNRAVQELCLHTDTILTEFKDYEETALSPYLLFEIWIEQHLEKSFVLDMKILLDDARLSRIFSSIINNRSRFLSYLSFLLSEEITVVHEEKTSVRAFTKNKINGNGLAFFDGSPVYEKLLLVSSREPAKLKKIDRLIQRLKDKEEQDGTKIIVPKFEEMWEIFRQYS